MNNKAKFVDRKITLIGITRLTTSGVDHIYDTYSNAGASGEAIEQAFWSASNAAALGTFSGRGCYKAYDISNKATQSARDYLYNILDQNHGSVLEHIFVNFHIENVSRAATHELVRHRHFSFSQESQRFVVERRSRDVVCPPAIREWEGLKQGLLEVCDQAFDFRDWAFEALKSEDGLKRKQAAEAARASLPNAAATSLVFSGNVRSLIEFIQKRIDPAADAELQEIASEILELLAGEIWELFDEDAREKWLNKDESAAQGAPKERTEPLTYRWITEFRGWSIVAYDNLPSPYHAFPPGYPVPETSDDAVNSYGDMVGCFPIKVAPEESSVIKRVNEIISEIMPKELKNEQ